MLERNDSPVPTSGVSRPLLAVIAFGVLVLVLAIENSERLHVHLLFWSASTPAYGLVAMSALLGAAVAESMAGLWRHRRQVHDEDRVELDRLRSRRHRQTRKAAPPQT